MPATNFPEYVREIQDTLDASVAAGEAVLVSIKALIFRYDNAVHTPPLPQAEHKHTPSGTEIFPPPTLAQVVDEILKGTQP